MGAMLQAAASAQSNCFSSVSGGGKAQGCAYSEAFVYAVSNSYATVHAQASSEAFAQHCSHKCANADSWSFSQSDASLFLLTDAYAEVVTSVCASRAPPVSARHSQVLLLLL